MIPKWSRATWRLLSRHTPPGSDTEVSIIPQGLSSASLERSFGVLVAVADSLQDGPSRSPVCYIMPTGSGLCAWDASTRYPLFGNRFPSLAILQALYRDNRGTSGLSTHGPHISIFASFSQDHAAVAGLQRRPWRWRNSLVAKTCSLGNGRFLSMVAAPKSVRHPLDCFAGLCVPALGPEHAGTTPSALSLTSRLGGTR